MSLEDIKKKFESGYFKDHHGQDEVIRQLIAALEAASSLISEPDLVDTLTCYNTYFIFKDAMASLEKQ